MEFLGSPNQSLRKKNVDMIIIHATASPTLESAVSWLRSPLSEASAHYVIGKDGHTVQLVQEARKAWHAGKSVWKKQSDLNQNSIGIELVNKNDGKDPYPDKQIEALQNLIKDIQEKYPNITDDRILGHNQVSPGRKTDPGVLFPWDKIKRG